MLEAKYMLMFAALLHLLVHAVLIAGLHCIQYLLTAGGYCIMHARRQAQTCW